MFTQVFSMRLLLFVTSICLIPFTTGCGSSDKWKDSRPTTSEASGVVTFNGKPLEEAQIVLVPEGTSAAGSALSGVNGEFSLAAFPPDAGVVPGTYNVMVVKSFVPQNPDPNDPESRSIQYAKALIPAKYSDARTSGLSITVPESGVTDLKLELVE